MKYKKLPLSKKRKIVEEAMAEKNITAVARRHGLSESTVSSWLSNDDFNPDKEYARARREKRTRVTRLKLKEPKDPIPEGIAVAANKNPEELAREVRDLRRKNAYLEDEVAYLKKLYEIMTGKKSDEAPKKKDSRR